MRSGPKFLIIFFLCAALAALASCGHKTPLSLEAFRPPQPPVNLKAVQKKNIISLSWSYTGPETLKDFIVEESCEKGITPEKGQAGMPFRPFRMVAKVTEGSYSEAIVFGRTYAFRVMAESASGVPGRPASIEVPALAPPPPPAGLRFKVGNEFITLKWNALGKWNGKAVFYNVYQGAPGAKPETLLNASPVSQNMFEASPDPGEATVYSVSGLLGGPFVYEGASSSITVRPSDFVPARPATPTALKTAEGIRLIWNSNPESWVTGYRIYKRINGKWEPAGFSSIPSYLDAGSTSGAYRITAVGSVAESRFSAAVSIAPGK